jgi:RHS repeat-associated protein
MLKNSDFSLGTSGWYGIDKITSDPAYGNIAYKSVANSQLAIAQLIPNVSHGSYTMSAILKSNNYADLTGIGFVFYYKDGSYTDYTWTPNKITDLGNGYKLYEKSGSSDVSKTIDRVDVRIYSQPNRTLEVSVAQAKFCAQNNMVHNNDFASGTSGWEGIDKVNSDSTYGNVAYKSVSNDRIIISQSIPNVPQGSYNMSAVLKSNNYIDLTGVGFVFYYKDGSYTDYTWTPNKVTDLGNGYKLYEKSGSSDVWRNIDRVDVRIFSGLNKTLDVSIAQVKFCAQNNMVQNNDFASGRSGWEGIDKTNRDSTYWNIAYSSVTNGRLTIMQSIPNVPHGSYKMSAVLKSNNYADLTGVGFVYYYKDGTYTDYTWTPNKVTDLGNGYKLYEKSGCSDESKTIDTVDIRIYSQENKTLDVSIANVNFVKDTGTIDSGQYFSNTQYEYNEINELKRENNPITNKCILYSYDVGGNIIRKTEYPYKTDISLGTPIKTINYTYDDSNWKDKLTSYDGKNITYDQIGNPLTYDGYTYAWEQGRQLKAISGNGKNLEFKYNDAGIRTEKKYNGVVTKYHLVGDKVTYEDNGSDKIYYTYDSSAHLVSMNLNGVEYYYIRNAQGDIIGLFDKSGAQVVSYTYDTWGKLISIDGSLKDSVGVKNPYRYRGYRYDTETGLYYLQSRYYNPEWGRFINADGIIGQTGELLGHNLFMYTKNNPVNMSDKSGFRPIYTMGEETDEMVAASVAVVATAARNNASNSKINSDGSSFSYKDSLLKGSKASAGDKIGEVTLGSLIKGKKVWESLGTLTLGKYATKYGIKASIGKTTLGALGSIGFAVWDCKNDINEGKYVGALVDGLGGLVGIGIGIGIGAVTGLLITASTPVIIAGGITALGIGVGVLVGVGIDKVTSGIKNEYYGR